MMPTILITTDYLTPGDEVDAYLTGWNWMLLDIAILAALAVLVVVGLGRLHRDRTTPILT